VTLIHTKQKRAAREQRNKYKPKTETRITPSNQTRWQAGGLSHIFGITIIEKYGIIWAYGYEYDQIFTIWDI